MEQCARAIIKDKDDFLLMKRTKNSNNQERIYYTTIGGHVEENETFEEACIREVFEEVGVIVAIQDLVYECYIEELDRYEKFYTVRIVSGQIGQGKGEEFQSPNKNLYGTFELVKLKQTQLIHYPILPIGLKELLSSQL